MICHHVQFWPHLPDTAASQERDENDERAEDDDDDGGRRVEVDGDILPDGSGAFFDQFGDATPVDVAVHGESQRNQPHQLIKNTNDNFKNMNLRKTCAIS